MHHAYLGGLLEHVISLCGHVSSRRPLIILSLMSIFCSPPRSSTTLVNSKSFATSAPLVTPRQANSLGHIVMELETVTRAIDKISGFPTPLKTVVQHLLISHHGQYEFGSPKLPMIREAMVFPNYLDDLDSKLAAVRVALANPSGDDELVRL